MSRIFFYSDPHFHHENMAIRRGFKNAEEMNNHIISEWNKIIHKKDTVILCGDITMEKDNYEILNKLNGIKKVILGNHDEPQHIKSLLKYVNSVQSMKYYKGIIITHAPIHPCELDYKYKYNIHGHVHNNSLDDKRYINVSAEVINYKPKLLKELVNE